jgi:drug/metabolite transporter (DMT)-like permease
MKTRQTESRWIAGLLLGAMVVSWSSGFIGYRYAADQGGVMLASFWRFLFAALILLPWGWSAIRSLGCKQIVGQAWVGVFAIAGFLTPIAKAIEWGLAPGVAALIANLLPVAIVALSLLSGQRTSIRQSSGLAVCFAGMLVSSLADIQAQGAGYWLYLLPLVGVLSLAGSSLLQRRGNAASVPALGALFIQICATLPLFALLAWHEGSLAPVLSRGFVAGVGWLIVFSTLGGYGFYWLCLRRFSMPTVSAALFLTPLVTALWAGVQFGERLTPWAITGSAITVLGVLVFASNGRKKPLPHRQETACSPDLNA